jgi:hypothetical protein
MRALRTPSVAGLLTAARNGRGTPALAVVPSSTKPALGPATVASREQLDDLENHRRSGGVLPERGGLWQPGRLQS